MLIAPGSTSRSVTMYAWNATTGLPYTTAAFGDAGIALWYRRGVTGAKTAISPVTLAALTTAWTSGGFLVIDENAYRLDVPDAAFAAGVGEVEIGGSATAWVLTSRTVELPVWLTPTTGATVRAVNGSDAALSTYAGGAVASVTGSVGSVAAGGITAASIATDAVDADALATDAVTEIAAGLPTTATIAAAVWAYLSASITTAGSIGAWIIARLTGGVVTYGGPVLTSGDIDVIQGDAYHSTDGTACEWVFTTNASLDWNGDTITLYMVNNAGAAFSKAGTCAQTGTTVTATVELTSAETLALAAGTDWSFQLRGTPGGATRPVTPVVGTGRVRARIGS